jgi:hypothetical protein
MCASPSRSRISFVELFTSAEEGDLEYPGPPSFRECSIGTIIEEYAKGCERHAVFPHVERTGPEVAICPQARMSTVAKPSRELTHESREECGAPVTEIVSPGGLEN